MALNVIGTTVRSHRVEELQDKEMYDLIPFSNCNIGSNHDMDILEKWKAHMHKQDVPYVVTRDTKGNCALWVEDKSE